MKGVCVCVCVCVTQVVFAARDASGEEDLYWCAGDDGCVLFTNELDSLPDDIARQHWQALQPGHYMAGKDPTPVQVGTHTHTHTDTHTGTHTHTQVSCYMAGKDPTPVQVWTYTHTEAHTSCHMAEEG